MRRLLEPYMEAVPDSSLGLQKGLLRCFFNLVNGNETISDDVGVEVSDFMTAKDQALKAINELREEYNGETETWSGWRLEVVCSDGTLLYSADLNTPNIG